MSVTSIIGVGVMILAAVSCSITVASARRRNFTDRLEPSLRYPGMTATYIFVISYAVGLPEKKKTNQALN